MHQTPERKLALAPEAGQDAGRALRLWVARLVRPQLRKRMKPAEREVGAAAATEHDATRADFLMALGAIHLELAAWDYSFRSAAGFELIVHSTRAHLGPPAAIGRQVRERRRWPHTRL